MLGKKHSAETRSKMSKRRSGAENGNWKGGLTAQTRGIRRSPEYTQWRLAVLKRDNRECQHEGCKQDTTISHHIKPIKTNPELIFDLNNGMTVCNVHHKLIHKQMRDAGKKN